MRLRVESVSFSYDGSVRAVDSIDLSVEAATSVALVGPNGSGKSTLLNLASGALRPLEGRVLLEGVPISTLNSRQLARRMAMVAQERPLGFDFTVREVVAMGRIPHTGRFSRESKADRCAIGEAMALCDIEDLSARSIRAVSGGERQRVFLSMALAQRPETLLLDEPTTHLDLRHQVQFMTIVQDRVQAGTAAAISIHDLSLAAQTCDRIALLAAGRLEALGDPKRILTQENVEQVFGVPVDVGHHRSDGPPYVIPRLSGPSL